MEAIQTFQFFLITKKRSSLRSDTIGLANSNLELKRDADRSRYRIQLHLDYSKIVFQIKPKFWTEIKYALTQYLAILAVVYLVIYQVKRFIFEEQLVQSDVQLSESLYTVQRHFARKP